MVRSIISRICVVICVIILTITLGVSAAVLLRTLGIGMGDSDNSTAKSTSATNKSSEGTQQTGGNVTAAEGASGANGAANEAAGNANGAADGTVNGGTTGSTTGGSAGMAKNENAAPTFEGDVLPLFRQDLINAIEMSGEGTTVGTFTGTTRHFTNGENGTEILLTKDEKGHDFYTVSRVSIISGTIVSFSGVRIGNLLKEINESLTRDKAEYCGDLTWVIDIDEITYSIKCTSIDNRTVASITVNLGDSRVEGSDAASGTGGAAGRSDAASAAGSNGASADGASGAATANSPAEWYALEPQYWE